MSDGASPIAVAVVLLETDEVARRLAVAWPRLPHDGREPDLLDWARIAGVRWSDAERVAFTLRKNGICTEDGGVSPDARRFLDAYALGALRQAGRAKPEARP